MSIFSLLYSKTNHVLKFKVDLIDHPASLRLYNMLETDLYLITTQYGTQNYMLYGQKNTENKIAT